MCALTDATRDKIADELQQMVKGLEATFGVKCDFEFSKTIQHYIMTLILQYLQKL